MTEVPRRRVGDREDKPGQHIYERRREDDKRAMDIEHHGQVNRSLLDILAVAIVALLLVSIATSVIAIAATRNVNKVEAQDRATQRAASYRQCSRMNVDRAFAHSVVKADLLNELETPGTRALPILDCTPNLRGRGATIKSIPEQREFVRRWVAGELTRAEQGICPHRKFEDPDPAKC